MMNKMLDKYKSMPVQVKASVWFLLCSFLQRGISVITTPIFTRLLTSAEYGQYSVFDSWLRIVTIFVSMHLYSGVYTQGLIKYSEDRNIYSSSLQGLTLTLTVLWSILYYLFKGYWNQLLHLTTIQMTAMLIMIWSSSAFHFWAAEQRVEYKYRRLVLATLLVSVAKPVIGIVFVIHSEDKVTARILGLALVELIGYVGFFVIQMKRGKKFYSSQYWKHAMRFNLPLIPHYLSQTVLNSADRIMISKMVGSSEAGIYSLAYSISQIMTLFNTALNQTLSPWIYQKIKDGRAKDITKIGYLALCLLALVNLFVILLAPEVVAVFAPPAYYDAIWVIPPVTMSVLFMFSYDLFAKFEFYYEKTKYIMVASVVGAGLNIILNLYFIRIFGYYAAAYTTLVCYIIYSLAHYSFMKMICQKNLNGIRVFNGTTLFVIFGLFMVVGFGLMITYNHPIIRYSCILLVIAIALYKRKEIHVILNRFFEIRNQTKKRI